MTLDQLREVIAAGQAYAHEGELLNVLKAMAAKAAEIAEKQPVAPWRSTEVNLTNMGDLPYAYAAHSPQTHHVVVRFEEGSRADHFVEWFNRGDWESYQKWHAQQAAVQPETAPFEMPPATRTVDVRPGTDEWRPGDLTAEILPASEVPIEHRPAIEGISSHVTRHIGSPVTRQEESKGLDTEVMPVVKDTRIGRRRRSQTGRADA